jgi:hypothetical protein
MLLSSGFNPQQKQKVNAMAKNKDANKEKIEFEFLQSICVWREKKTSIWRERKLNSLFHSKMFPSSKIHFFCDCAENKNKRNKCRKECCPIYSDKEYLKKHIEKLVNTVMDLTHPRQLYHGSVGQPVDITFHTEEESKCESVSPSHGSCESFTSWDTEN